MERTLLLVDDEENITSALIRLLRRDGYNILKASSGKEGLELLTQHKVGVIISDQLMAGMTGVEFLSKVKELYPDTVRIVLSGYTELKSVTDAINRGAIYKFLTKPWEDELLRANVEEAFIYHEMKMENVRLNKEVQLANEKLLGINRNLEKLVEEKAREVIRNLDMLRISQEVLEHLPVGVVGIGEDGMIAIANQKALKLFAGEGAISLIGEMANEVLPVELQKYLSVADCKSGEGKVIQLAVGRSMYCRCNRMGELSSSKGVVLIIDSIH